MKEPLVLLVEDNPHIMDINTAALTMRGLAGGHGTGLPGAVAPA